MRLSKKINEKIDMKECMNMEIERTMFMMTLTIINMRRTFNPQLSDD